MKCKYCGAEWEAEGFFCPQCGKNNAEDAVTETAEPAAEETVEVVETEEVAAAEEMAEAIPEQPKKKGWKIAVAVIACVAVLAAAAAGIWYFINGGWTPRPNDEHYKLSYTVSDEKAIKSADQVVATFAGEELTNSQLQVYYWMQFYDFMDYFGSYLGYYFDLDYTKPLDEQIFAEAEDENGVDTTWQQYFLAMALESWQQDVIKSKLAAENNHQLGSMLQEILDTLEADTQQTAVEAGYETADALVQEDFGAATDYTDYAEYLNRMYFGSEWFQNWTDALNPSVAEVEAYFDAHAGEFEENGVTKDSKPIVDVRHILVIPEGDGSTGEDGYPVYTEDAWAAAKAEADAIYDSWKQGPMTEESFAELAMQKSEDGSASKGGLIEEISEGQMVENFENWILDESRKPGDHDLIQSQFGYHIMYFVEGTESWYFYGLEQYLYDKGNEMLEAEMAKHELVVSYRKIQMAEKTFD